MHGWGVQVLDAVSTQDVGAGAAGEGVSLNGVAESFKDDKCTSTSTTSWVCSGWGWGKYRYEIS